MAAMPNLLVRDNAAAVAAVFRFLRGRPENVPSKLTAVGIVACSAAVTFLGGLVAIWAGLWVEADVPRRATAGQVFLCCALVLLLVAVNLTDAYDPAVTFNLFLGAMD